MRRFHWLLGGIAGVALGASSASGCGSSVVSVTGEQGAASSATNASATGTTGTSTTISASSSGSSGTGGALAEPPGPPAPTPPDGTGVTTFAISEVFAGDTDRCSPAPGSAICDGTLDMVNGWRHLGFDVDGLVHAPPYANLCKPAPGAIPGEVFENGDLGIDNSFGKNILPILLGTDPTAPTPPGVGQLILDGDYTIMLAMVGLGSSATESPLLTRLYTGGVLGSHPLFDGSDHWPVTPGSLIDPTDVTSAKVTFPSSYLTQDTWVSGVSGGVGTVVVRFWPSGVGLDLPIQAARIALDLDPTHRHGTNGTISGVLDTQTFIDEIQALAASIDPTFCDTSNPTLQAIVTQIAQASDILHDGTQDPTKPCDGISIGLGFNAERVQLGGISPPPPAPPPNPCGDGG